MEDRVSAILGRSPLAKMSSTVEFRCAKARRILHVRRGKGRKENQTTWCSSWRIGRIPAHASQEACIPGSTCAVTLREAVSNVPCTLYPCLPCTLYPRLPCTLYPRLPCTLYPRSPCTVYPRLPCTLYPRLPCTLNPRLPLYPVPLPCTLYPYLVPCPLYPGPVPCTLYPVPVPCTLYHVPCTLYLVLCTWYPVPLPCTLYLVPCTCTRTPYLVPCTLYPVPVPCTLYLVPCTLYRNDGSIAHTLKRVSGCLQGSSQYRSRQERPRTVRSSSSACRRQKTIEGSDVGAKLT